MLLALDGNEAAYRTLLGDLSRLLRYYFQRRLYGGDAAAEDLVQETLLAIHKRRITYDRTLPLLPWVSAIARYKLIDYLRRQGKMAVSDLDDDVPFPDESEAVLARMDVDRMLDEIPARTAGVIRMVKIDGQSIAEAAEKSGLSQSAIKVIIHRGMSALKKQFGGGE